MNSLASTSSSSPPAVAIYNKVLQVPRILPYHNTNELQIDVDTIAMNNRDILVIGA